MGERVGEARDQDLEDLAAGVEERIEGEIRRRLGRKAQYIAVINVKRSGDGGIDLGIDLQVFSPASVDSEKLFKIVDEVIDAGFSEAEKLIKRSRERAGGGLEDKEDSSGVTPISRS